MNLFWDCVEGRRLDFLYSFFFPILKQSAEGEWASLCLYLLSETTAPKAGRFS